MQRGSASRWSGPCDRPEEESRDGRHDGGRDRQTLEAQRRAEHDRASRSELRGPDPAQDKASTRAVSLIQRLNGGLEHGRTERARCLASDHTLTPSSGTYPWRSPRRIVRLARPGRVGRRTVARKCSRWPGEGPGSSSSPLVCACSEQRALLLPRPRRLPLLLHPRPPRQRPSPTRSGSPSRTAVAAPWARSTTGPRRSAVTPGR